MKNVMKKAGAMFLSAALAAVLLAGCGGGTSQTTKPAEGGKTPGTEKQSDAPQTEAGQSGGEKKFAGIKLVYWSNWEAAEPQGVVITAAVKDFEAKTGAQVDLQFKGRKGIREGLIPALDAGQQIDMFNGARNKSNFGDRIMCLEDLVKQNDYEKDTNPVLMKMCRSYYKDNQLFEIPYQMNAHGYLYNKALFRQAGIEKAPETWDDFLNACQKLKDSGVIPLTTDDAYAVQAFGTHLSRLIGNDGVKEVVTKGLWDKPEVKQTAEAFADLAAKGYFSPQVGSNVWPTGQNTELATGLAAMYCVGTYVVNETKNITGPDFEWGFFSYPEPAGAKYGQDAMVLGCQGFAITSKCEHPEAAFALIETLTRGEWDAKLAEESLGLPADLNNTSWPEQLKDVKVYIDNCKTLLDNAGGLESNPDIIPALKENLLKVYAGTMNADEFTANMLSASKK